MANLRASHVISGYIVCDELVQYNRKDVDKHFMSLSCPVVFNRSQVGKDLDALR